MPRFNDSFWLVPTVANSMLCVLCSKLDFGNVFQTLLTKSFDEFQVVLHQFSCLQLSSLLDILQGYTPNNPLPGDYFLISCHVTEKWD